VPRKLNKFVQLSRHYKSPPLYIVIRIHLIPLSYIILDFVVPSHLISIEQMLMLIIMSDV